MDISFLIELTPIFQISVAVFFGIGIISLLFLGIRIGYLKRALKKWTKESRRISNDPTLDQIIKIYRLYNEKGCEKTNTAAMIRANYYKQKIFFIPIYYWEQLISKSEILCLFFGLITTFILVSAKYDNPFYPLIFGTGTFIILVVLEMILSLDEKRKYLFVEMEEFLDNSYKHTIQRSMLHSEYFNQDNIEIFDSRDKKHGKHEKEVNEEINDEEIEWIIKQFYEGENEV